jgi:N-acetylmuramoyl-L-alanine amidase
VNTTNQTDRLKAQMLRAAVQENADTIADRLPAALRPARRWLRLCLHHSRLVVPPVLILATIFVARWSLAAESPVVPAPPAVTASWLGVDGPAAVSAPDVSLLARPLPPSALGLGVRRVVLDAGHGGAHVGTVSAAGLLEKDITLDLAQRSMQLLVERGFEVVMTRTDDAALSLKDRATTANQQRGDIFVSIHLNALAQGSGPGVETFYLGPSSHPELDAIAAAENQHSGYALADLRTLLDGIYVDARRDESKRLARSVQDAVFRRLRKTDPTMDDRGVKTAPFVVLVATDMPAILAEVSCLSDATEAARLGTAAHRQAIAEALVGGIQAFSNQQTHPVGQRKDTNER